MKRKANQFRKMCLVGGIIFTQLSSFEIGSSTVYAVIDNKASGIVIKTDKSKVKVDEDIIFTVQGMNNQADQVELILPEGFTFNEEATKELNQQNEMVEVRYLIDSSIVQVKRKLQNSTIDNVKLSIKANKLGNFKFIAKSQHEEMELKTNEVDLKVEGFTQQVVDEEIVKQSDNFSKKQINKLNEETKVSEKKSTDEQVKVCTEEDLSHKKAEIVSSEEETEISLQKEVLNEIDENTYGEEQSDVAFNKGSTEMDNITINGEEPYDEEDENAEIVDDRKQMATIPVEHADRSYESILNYPNVKIIDFKDGTGPAIPADTSLQWRWSSKVEYKVVGSETDNNLTKTYYDFKFKKGAPDKEAYVHIGKAGMHMGRWLDIRINIVKVDRVTDIRIDTPRNSRGAGDFLQITYWGPTRATADISYEFYDHETGEEIEVSGIWNFNKLNRYKAIDLRTDENHLSDLFTYNHTTIAYKESGEGTTDFWGNGGTAETPDTNMTFTYRNLKKLPMRIRLEATKSRVRYERKAISKIAIPRPEVMGEVVEDDSRELYYHVYQDIPPQANTSYNPNSFAIESTVNPSFKVKDIKILDESETDVSSYFDITNENNKIIAKAKDNIVSKESFSDKFYDMQIRGSLIEGADSKSYYKNGYLEIPVAAKNYVDGDEKGQTSNQDIAKIKYKGIPMGEAVPQIVKVGTDLSKIDISNFVTNLSVDTNAEIDKPISVVRLEDIPKTDALGDYTVTAIIKTNQGVEAKVKVPIKIVEGTLKLVDVPKVISFNNLVISSKPTIYNPSFIDGKVTVVDGRAKKQKWRLGVKEVKPLTSNNNDQLIGAMVYTDEKGINHTLNMENTEVLSHTLKDDNNYDVFWNENQGIRLQVVPGPNVKTNTKYQGELQWTLTDAPI